ncbi:hypothetical protein Smp_066330.2 [Schistosoma mansoni]|uniref:hypothetical protein n=1 Tax=Schistosoma mansoni TaxID=6183 RepID=UPI00022DC6D2|nr:hypothetical protein Smp_066330.2 [Schistosoma mansoni]|eukprot:XP_018650701.1 hypothetical protein Smp_066330.2 [Schistosoma mansoni]
MGVLKHVLQSPISVQLHSLALNFSSQIEKACCQPDSTFLRFLSSTHRTLLANLFLCRHSGTLIFRRLREKYFSLHSNINTDSRLFITQKVLLGGSLISFAQDKITDEEVLTTLKSFSVNGDSNNSNKSSSFVVVENNTIEEDTCSPVEDRTRNEHCESWDPPLTLMIRELRKTYLNRISMFSHPTTEPVIVDDSCISACDPDPHVDEISNEDHFSASLSSLFMDLNIQPDGTGFVDESWELVYDRTSMHVWRRRLTVPQVNGERNPPKPNAKYEYRVCGQFRDISASSFLEVQLNLDYRRKWDDKIVELHCITPNNDTHIKDLDIIRWVVRFPFPMVDREYVYVRRWWIQPTEFSLNTEKSLASHKDNSSESIPLSQDNTTKNISTRRYAYLISRCSADFKEKCTQSSDISSVKSSWENIKKRGLVQVHEYHSEMLIESHGEFNQNGLNYYLIYYDDPCLPINGSPIKLFSVRAIEEFMTKLHKAALQLCHVGLPIGIRPIIYDNNSNTTTNNNTNTTDSEIKLDPNPDLFNASKLISPSSSSSSSSTSPTTKKQFSGKKLNSYFFTDRHPSELNNNYIDSTAAALS